MLRMLDEEAILDAYRSKPIDNLPCNFLLAYILSRIGHFIACTNDFKRFCASFPIAPPAVKINDLNIPGNSACNGL